MTLEFIDHRAVRSLKHSWTPFTSSDGYEHPRWWLNAGGAIGDPWFVQVLEDGTEVARVQFDERGGINLEYTGAPELGPERLKIQFIEVAMAARRRGIGTRVVHGLAQRHPDRRLLAYSEGADHFWESLSGWERFDHPDGRHQPLFIQSLRNNHPGADAEVT
ncbi:GNAT family N-acetyltransferase [Mycolicibacterium sp. jd]|uniref:GNAT family N-acetyltransferase n=1 Tax=Mycolicibacterium TaxID=1866885 RepID=UPI001F3CF6AC|nr:GNAT family N-acetyltransferase [Mycolicibacterium vanbaalenii]UJL30429.1 GNAT family N-acetyltransferase [Mycolicibacterium vanbaalenii]WND56476.1 GNAT family N-acetyltransferase [Mycolicibacterium vanbaalenii]